MVREHVKAFLEHLRLNENASAHTVRAYESDLSQYLGFLAQHLSRRQADLVPADLDYTSARAFLGSLNNRGNTKASAARKLSAIKAFGRYLRREGLLETDPAALVGRPSGSSASRRTWRSTKCPSCSRPPTPRLPLGRRDRAILELFYASGLRLSELVGLDLEDVNLSGRVVRVLGKGRKERIVPFNRSAADAIRAWLADREQLLRPDDPGLCHGDLTARRRPRAAGVRPQGPAAPRPAVPQLSGRPPVDPQRRQACQALCCRVQHPLRHQPACAPPLVCHPSARSRRRPSRDPGAARTRPSDHDPALHPRERRATDGVLPAGAPQGVNKNSNCVSILTAACRRPHDWRPAHATHISRGTTMRRLVMVAFAFACLLLAARLAAAKQQEPPPLPATRVVMPAAALQTGPLSTEQQRELQKWLDNITPGSARRSAGRTGRRTTTTARSFERKSSRRLRMAGRLLHDDRRDPHRFARAEERAGMRHSPTALRGS